MGSMSMADSLILMVLALVVFGPRRLPQIGRQIGKLMYEFRKASNDFKFQMEEELRQAEEADRRKKEEEARQQRALEAPKQESVSADPQIVNAVEVPEYARPEAGTGQAGSETATLNATAEADAAGSAEAGTSEAAAEQPGELRVAPPSTGETVAVTPPWKRTQAEAATQDESAAGEAAPAVRASQPTESTEAVSQNG